MSKPWSSEDDAVLVRMRSLEHEAWTKIGAVLDRSKTACHYRYTAIVPAGEQVKIKARKTWTPEDEAKIAQLRNEKKTFQEIADLTGMTIGQVSSKFERMRVPQKRIHFETETARFFVPQRCLEDRDRRYAAGPRDLTGILCGDPPVGFSMLERRV